MKRVNVKVFNRKDIVLETWGFGWVEPNLLLYFFGTTSQEAWDDEHESRAMFVKIKNKRKAEDVKRELEALLYSRMAETPEIDSIYEKVLRPIRLKHGGWPNRQKI